MSFAADDDLSAEAEEKLGDHFGIPVFVKNYPFSKKAFYMKHYGDIDGIERAICADLIAPEGAGEVATCAVRENSYENLVRNLRDRGQSAEEYSWYLDVRRYGGCPMQEVALARREWFAGSPEFTTFARLFLSRAL